MKRRLTLRTHSIPDWAHLEHVGSALSLIRFKALVSEIDHVRICQVISVPLEMLVSTGLNSVSSVTLLFSMHRDLTWHPSFLPTDIEFGLPQHGVAWRRDRGEGRGI